MAVLVTGGALAGYFLLRADPTPPPDLSLKEYFPVGFDTQEVALRGVSFDGDSRCWGALNLHYKWGKTGILPSEKPTTEAILAANPLRPEYEVAAASSEPISIDDEPLPVFRPMFSSCEVRYEAEVWEVDATIRNHVPVRIQDQDNLSFQYGLTGVMLGGSGGQDDGTRFLVQGTAPNPENLTLEYRLFPQDQYEPDAALASGVTAPTLTNNTSFVFVIDVGAHSVDEAELMLIPAVANGTQISAPAGLSFQHLFRLEDSEAQAMVSKDGGPLPEEPASAAEAPPPNTFLYRTHSVEEALAWVAETSGATEDSSADDFQASGHAAFLIQTAVEPLAKPGATGLVQSTRAWSGKSTTSLAVDGPEGTQLTRFGYGWRLNQDGGSFVFRIVNQPVILPAATVARAAGVTAALTHIAADGLVAVDVIVDGPTIDDALTVAARVLDARGRVSDLGDALGSSTVRNAWLRSANAYYLAAAALDAGREWMHAEAASDPFKRLHHQNRAADIALFAIASLTPQGALTVAAFAVAQYALERAGAEPLLYLAQEAWDFGRTLITGHVSEANAREAFADAVPRIQAFANEHHAGVLNATSEAPQVASRAIGLPVVGLGVAIAAGAARFVRRD